MFALKPLYLLFFLAFCPSIFAAEALFSSNGVAINGYDAVSYHLEQQPRKGDVTHQYQWKGASWQFSNAHNKALFIANPEKYAPQYGGFCAYAASKNALAPTDPQAWTVRDGKLYLNFSTAVRSRWQQDVIDNIRIADGNWPGLKMR